MRAFFKEVPEAGGDGRTIVTTHGLFGLSLSGMSHAHAQLVARILGVSENFSKNQQELRGVAFGL